MSLAKRRSRLAASSSSASSTSNRRKPAKLSERVQGILSNELVETDIQNTYAPSALPESKNVSFRPLTLSLQRSKARLDGHPTFQVPSLTTLCADVVASIFAEWILPTRDAHQQADRDEIDALRSKKRPPHRREGRPVKRPKKGARAFGSDPGPDDSGDYVDPDSAEPDTRSSRTTRRSASQKAIEGKSQTSPSGTSSSTSNLQTRPFLTSSELSQLAERNMAFLKMLPPASSFALFNAMRRHCPQMLNSHVVSSCFLPRLPDLSSPWPPRTHVLLPASLPLLGSRAGSAPLLLSHMAATLSRLATGSPSSSLQSHSTAFSLTSLQLHGLTRLENSPLIRLFSAHLGMRPRAERGSLDVSGTGLLRLEVVSLKGCVQVGDDAVKAICKACAGTLRYLNLDFTDCSAESLGIILQEARKVEVLKLGNVLGLSDLTVPPVVERAVHAALKHRPPYVPLSRLSTLRLRHTNVGDLALGSLLKLCGGTLRRLDVSYSLVCSDGDVGMLAHALGADVARGRTVYRLRRVLRPASQVERLICHSQQALQRGEGENDAKADRQTGVPPASPSCRLEKLNLSGLAIHCDDLMSFLYALCTPPSITDGIASNAVAEDVERLLQARRVEPLPPAPALHSLYLADLVLPRSASERKFAPPKKGLPDTELDCLAEALECLALWREGELQHRSAGPAAAPAGPSWTYRTVSLAGNELDVRPQPPWTPSGLARSTYSDRLRTQEFERTDSMQLAKVLRVLTPRCHTLDLSRLVAPTSVGYRYLDLSPSPLASTGSIGQTGAPVPGRAGLRNLTLNDSRIGDEALADQPRPFGGGRLEKLGLADSGITTETLDGIVDDNPFLTELDLTRCRGIPVTRRRCYFS